MKKRIKKLLRENLLIESKFEYQIRDIDGFYLYYKRKSENDMWEFIDKDEFDKKSNKDNIIKYKE
jgi:hypothetical protein